jgi:hypothetical protein
MGELVCRDRDHLLATLNDRIGAIEGVETVEVFFYLRLMYRNAAGAWGAARSRARRTTGRRTGCPRRLSPFGWRPASRPASSRSSRRRGGILREASDRGVPVRLVGGLAIRLHAEPLHAAFAREYKDIDLVTVRSSGGGRRPSPRGTRLQGADEFNALNGHRRLLSATSGPAGGSTSSWASSRCVTASRSPNAPTATPQRCRSPSSRYRFGNSTPHVKNGLTNW